ncbi:hypothetical protein CL657_03170 [bacterium]|nr:hypothetical protein [bacterium]
MITGLFIGNELCDGRITNTNQQFIAQRLFENGFYLNQSLTLDDSLKSLVPAINTALKQATVIITTGGLGPTEDDRTTQAIAKACGLDLVRDQAALTTIKAYFKKTNRDMPPENAKQADFPQGATPLANSRGTAPGFYLCFNNVHIVACPGPPNELDALVIDHLLPLLKRHVPFLKRERLCKLYNCVGIGESHCAERLQDLYPLPTGIAIGFQAKPSLVQVRVQSYASQDSTEFDRLCTILDQRLADVCFSNTSSDNLETIIIENCHQLGLQLACAESCTGGLLSNRLIAVSGASKVCQINLVTYSDESKCTWLDVDPTVIQQYGAVSDNTVIAMANGLRKKTNADITIAISGIAGPTGGTAEKPVGTVYFGISTAHETVSSTRLFLGSRRHIQKKATQYALQLLFQTIQSLR